MVDAVLTGAYFNLQPFTNNFPRADIHKLLSPNLLHQLIKGTFKDHLVTWVEEYLTLTHGEACAKEILDDIDWQYFIPIFKSKHCCVNNMF